MSKQERAKRRRVRLKQRKAADLKSASDKGWKKHTDYHWYTSVKGQKLDWWPSTRKAQYNGIIYKQITDINQFLNELWGLK